MSKYNFFNKIDLIKYFNATSDITLQKAILNEFDSLDSLKEKQDFVSKVKGTGIDIKSLTSTKLYNEKKNEELSYEEAEKVLRKFRNSIEEDEEITNKLNPYMKELYNSNKDEYELATIIKDAFEYDEEDNKVFKSQNYYNMMQSFENKIQNYNNKQEEKLNQNRVERNSDKNDNINIDFILKNLD